MTRAISLAKKAAETVGFLAFMTVICWSVQIAQFLMERQ